VTAEYEQAKELIVDATENPEDYFDSNDATKVDALAKACVIAFGDSDSMPASERPMGFEDDDELDDIWEDFCETVTDQFYSEGFVASEANRGLVRSIGHHYPTWHCLLLDCDESNALTVSELAYLASFPACVDDEGRDDQCIGQHFMIAQHPNVTSEILESILTVEHHDPALLKWIVAANPKTAANTLEMLADSSDYSWRIQGLFQTVQTSPGTPQTTGINDSVVPFATQSLVLWSLAGNAAIPESVRRRLATLESINTDKGPSDGWRMPEDSSQAVKAIRERLSANGH